MSGFAVTVGASADTLKAVVEAMTHRGPLRATHRTDASVSVQLDRDPVRIARREHLSLVGDIRLDNRGELLTRLGISDDIDDRELVLSAYTTDGPQVCRTLRGDFAFAVIDEAEQSLFCARDPFGARPLYYAEGPGFMACASEPAALTRLHTVPRRANLEQVSLLVAGYYNEAGPTVFEGVHALPGGHTLSYRDSASRMQRFWAPDPWRRRDVDLDEAAALVREQVRSTLKRRVGHGDVAVYLSGGLDSAIVAGELASLRRETRGPSPTIVHASFPGSTDDETDYSDAVADMWGLPRINTRPLNQPDRLAPSLRRAPDVWWDPRLGMWEDLCEVTRDAGITRGLTGDGIDECLAGTGSEWADDVSLRGIARALKGSGLLRRPWSRSRWHQLIAGSVLPRFPRAGVHLDRGQNVLASGFSTRVKAHRLERAARHRNRAYPDLVNRDLCSVFEEGDTNVVLAANERVGAHGGIEIREAFMDVDLVELLLSLPHEHRHTVGLDKPKPVLRRAMKHVLPESVASRPVSGTYVDVLSQVLFEPPIRAVDRVFSAPSRLLEAGIIRPEIAHLLRENPSQLPAGYSSGSWAMQATSLVAMEILLRQL